MVLPVPGASPVPSFTGGASTSGDIGPTDVGFGPVNIGGLFGSDAQSANQFITPLIVIGGIVAAVIFLRRR